MNSIDLQSFLSQRCDIMRSFYSECEKDHNVSIEIDLKLLEKAILRAHNLIEEIINDVERSIVPETFYEHLQHDIEQSLPNKFPTEFRLEESKLLSYKTIAGQIMNIEELYETYAFYKKLGFAQKKHNFSWGQRLWQNIISKFAEKEIRY